MDQKLNTELLFDSDSFYTVAELWQIVLRFDRALHQIAAWHEGDQVDCAFDEPHSARIARQALEKVE